ncbi:SLC13 family permease [Paenibacillus ferrarius]|uniref:SLC13 family permease n=1 Tax=Paenibacillus ferrarius TaxID=1469647 RepID=UPI003D2CF5B4
MLTEFSQGPVLWQTVAALVIFAAAYLAILIEKWDRTYTALVGAVLMIALGIVPIQKALTGYANWPLVLYIASLFILSALIGQTGVLAYAASGMLRKFRLRPIAVLISVSLLAALVAACFDSLIAVALIVPFLLKTSKMMKITPVPFLISVLISVHIGGAATIMGNLPNRLIAGGGRMTPGQLVLQLAPLVLLLLAVLYLIMWGLYRNKLIVAETYKRELLRLTPSSYLNADRNFVVIGTTVIALTLIALMLHRLLGMQPAFIAAIGAVLSLAANYKAVVQTAVKKDYRALWHTFRDMQVLYFLGLFIMAGGLTYSGIAGFFAYRGLEMSQGSVSFLSTLVLWLTGFGSAMMDEVPYIAAMMPIVDSIREALQASVQPIWLALIIGSAIGGSATLISSVTNMYAASLSEQEGGGLTQRGYVAVALPVCLILIVIATLYFRLFLV